jgi:hypothetical protein
MAAWAGGPVVLSGNGEPQQINVSKITPGLFEMVGGSPAMGRLFAAGDELAGRPPIAILSYGLWQQQFGGRRDIIGQTVRFDGTTYTIVGVMPQAFVFPDRQTRAWLPFRITPMTTPGQRGGSIQMFQAIGRNASRRDARTGLRGGHGARTHAARRRARRHGRIRQQRARPDHRAADARRAGGRRQAGHPHSACRGRAAAGDGDGQRREPAARARHRAAARAGRTRGARRGAHAPGRADAGREPGCWGSWAASSVSRLRR